jgi:hypothetical protein
MIKPEPVAWRNKDSKGRWVYREINITMNPEPLYAAPPQREWQGLTNEELRDIFDSCQIGDRGYVAAMVEAKLKEKNSD